MTVIDTYTLQIVRQLDVPPHPGEPLRLTQSVAVAEAAENITDLLPEGYRAVIRRWDEEDNPDE